jgi:YVTN family beta-propeller protein
MHPSMWLVLCTLSALIGCTRSSMPMTRAAVTGGAGQAVESPAPVPARAGASAPTPGSAGSPSNAMMRVTTPIPTLDAATGEDAGAQPMEHPEQSTMTTAGIPANMQAGRSGEAAGQGGDASGTTKSTIYVAIYADDEITVIDESSAAIVDHIKVGRGPAIVLETPDHAKLYTANWVDNTVSAVQVRDHKLTAIQHGGQPFVIANSPDGRFVYAGLKTNVIDVIDTATDKVTHSFPMAQFPMSVIVSADSTLLYVSFPDATIEAIDAQTGKVVHAAIATGAAPGWITITPDGSKVYTLNWGSGDLTVVDTRAWKVITTVPLGATSYPIIGAVTPDNSVLCVTTFGTTAATLIETQNHRTLHALKFDGRPTGVNFSPDGVHGYVTDYGQASLAQDPNTLIAIGSGGRYPMNPGPGRLTIFSTADGTLVKQISVGHWPSSVIVQHTR